uniref:PACE efflux transporter n=1 Tax=Halomonas sp. TaxID=1486246 RepID=UPI002605F817|nr:PACE efflux transporter [Halomonas sp.]
MRSFKERLAHMSLFELGGLVIVTPLASAISGHGLGEIGILAAGLATIAMLWNLVWNWFFDRLVPTRQRTIGQRFAQAMGFELGLLLGTLPIVAWWLNIGLIEAFWLDAGFMLFFLCYAMIFNSLFDRVMQRRLAKQASKAQQATKAQQAMREA